MNDDGEIRTLIERWAKAVHAGDMDGVLADHADDIVMFDVPPPERGQVPTAGRPVRDRHPRRHGRRERRLRARLIALRNGGPDNRLRLTIGLRKNAGRWTVTHEHHSFPDKS